MRNGPIICLTATIYALLKDYSKTLAKTAAEPVVADQTKYFLANISKVKSSDDLLSNSKLYAGISTDLLLSLANLRAWRLVSHAI
jgi:hypothetical protein